MRDTVAEQTDPNERAESERAAAFRRLADRHLYESYKLANAILGNSSESQDAVHDAVVTAWERWSSLRDQTKFDAWFHRIVVNKCRNRLQLSEHRNTTGLSGEIGPTVSDASTEVLDREQLGKALMQLDPDDRILLALRHYQDLKLGAIAGLLDIPTGTVKSRLNRAHKRLRSAIDANQPEEPAR